MSYENNIDLTYQDGEVVKEVITFTNAKFSFESKTTFEGSIVFAKPVPYLSNSQ